MEFRVLGAFEVLDEGNSVPLGGRKQRSLLAILLLRANKVVSSDALIDELWGERPPASAQHTLQAYVSRLRKVLRETGDGRPVLVSYPAGYLLRVASGELDLDRFEHLAEEGRRALPRARHAMRPRRAGQRSRCGPDQRSRTSASNRSRVSTRSASRSDGSPSSRTGSRRTCSWAGTWRSSPNSRPWWPSIRSGSGCVRI
jgi:DNA-binding SARP family transcriptional activator